MDKSISNKYTNKEKNFSKKKNNNLEQTQINDNGTHQQKPVYLSFIDYTTAFDTSQRTVGASRQP